MNKVVFHGIAEIAGSRVWGRALVPGISRNGNLYTPDVIEHSKNLNVPLKLDWEHTDEIIGTITYTYDKELQELHYDGIIRSEGRKNEIKEGTYQVSIEGVPERIEHVCTPRQCYNMPIELTWEGLGITNHPGVTASTLLVESEFSWNKVRECEHHTKHPLESEIDFTKDFTKFRAAQEVIGKQMKAVMDHLDLESCEDCDGIHPKKKNK